METLELIDFIADNYELFAVAFVVGGFYIEAKRIVKRIMTALDNTATTHSVQNQLLDVIHDKIDRLDGRVEKIESNIELIHRENNEQAIKLAVLETQAEIIDHPVKRRQRRSA
jgi:hypothetical protein